MAKRKGGAPKRAKGKRSQQKLTPLQEWALEAKKEGRKPRATAWRNSKGRLVSVGKYGEPPPSIGRSVPTKFGTSQGEARTDAQERYLVRGQIPPPDATRTVFNPKRPTQKINVYLWRFEGPRGQEFAPEVMRLIAKQDPKALVRFRFGTGFGKNAQWAGSRWNFPVNRAGGTAAFFHKLQNRYVTADEKDWGADGDKIWYELEAQTTKDLVFGDSHNGGRQPTGFLGSVIAGDSRKVSRKLRRTKKTRRGGSNARGSSKGVSKQPKRAGATRKRKQSATGKGRHGNRKSVSGSRTRGKSRKR